MSKKLKKEKILENVRYENQENELIWTFTAYTKGGAFVLAKRYRDKFGSEIVEEPFERDDGVWVFMVTNPFYQTPH